MKKTIINKQTKMLPLVQIEEDKITINGRFIDNDHSQTESLFANIEKAIEDMDINEISCELEYLSSLPKTKLLLFLGNLEKDGKMRILHWTYEEDDEDIKELGKHYQNCLNGYAFVYCEIT